MVNSLKRVIRAGEPGGGKVVGRYFIAKDARRIELTLDKFNREFRHTVEFILRTSPYELKDLMALDYMTFFRVANECEDREKEAIDRLEKQAQAHGGH